MLVAMAIAWKEVKRSQLCISQTWFLVTPFLCSQETVTEVGQKAKVGDFSVKDLNAGGSGRVVHWFKNTQGKKRTDQLASSFSFEIRSSAEVKSIEVTRGITRRSTEVADSPTFFRK